DRRHLVRTTGRPMRTVGQTLQPALFITTQPLMHRLAGHPELLGHRGHGQPVDLHGHHSLITLFHLAQLLEHSATPSPQPTEGRGWEPRGQASADTPSTIRRYRVADQPLTNRRQSAVPKHTTAAPPGMPTQNPPPKRPVQIV